VASILLALWFYGLVGGWLGQYLNSRALANFLGFVLIFIGVNLLGGLVGMAVSRVVKFSGLSFMDHLLGAGFGVLRAGLVAIVLVMAIMAFSSGDKPPASVVHSRLAPYVVDASRVISAMAPHELKTGFQKTYAQVKRAWEEALKMHLPGRSGKAKDEREI
jgi:membrane protein required for colicin V production